MTRASRAFVALTSAVVVGGCVGWHPIHLEPGTTVPLVRVETALARSWDVSDAVVGADSVLVGRHGATGKAVRIHLSEIVSAEHHGTDPARSTHLALLTGAMGFAALIVTYAAAIGGS